MSVVTEDLRRAARFAYERADHGKLKKACRAILEADPQDADARRLLGLAALKEDRPDLAEAWLRETTARRPDSASAWRNLARALIELRREREAEAILSAAAARGVSTAGTMVMLGAIRARLDRAEDARAAYDGAIETDPTRGDAYWGLAETGGLAIDSAAYAQAEHLLRAGRFQPVAAAAAGLALAEADRRAGRLADFIARAHAANAVLRGLAPRGGPAPSAWRQALRDAAAEARIAKRQEARPAASAEAPQNPAPIFLVGEPCCGAELAEALLASEPGAYAAGDIGLFKGAVGREMARAARSLGPVSAARLTPEQRAQAREAYLERARRIAPDARWFIDRSAGLAPHAGTLRILFPEARIIRLERSGLRQGLDIYRRFRTDGDPRASDLKLIGRELRLARRAAARIARHSELKIAVVDIEALAASPLEAGAKLRAAAGLPVALQTFSSPQERRAMRAIHAFSDDDLKALAHELAPLKRGLGELARD
jgi:tetratricopeptide (TPR) repeat protein